MKTLLACLACVVLLELAVPTPLQADTQEVAIVDAASNVLDEIMAIPIKRIPEALLADAQGIAIIPDLVKGGFVVGVRFGRGVVVVRDEAGAWKPPVFITLTGGSVGWQAGLQATDLILVFKTRRSVEGLMRGKFTLGADAAAAAGPVGREAAAATDAALKAEILSYSRSRGLFAGVSLDGSAMQIDARANAAYYGGLASPLAPAPGQAVELPPSAARLLDHIAKYAAPGAPGPDATLVPGDTPPFGADPAATAKQQLADAARRLYPLLDESWQRFLALPAEVYTADRHASPESLGMALRQFDGVAAAPQYRSLTERPEFQATHDLLRRYLALRSLPETAPRLALPPPPIRPGPQ